MLHSPLGNLEGCEGARGTFMRSLFIRISFSASGEIENTSIKEDKALCKERCFALMSEGVCRGL